ncbi:hypothetical protein VTJ83DRAFT_7371 [Remersonia thermophila]|uniref:peptidylprolyl isomerase n=1 Tax=Remersonia thermophila TaxID=72144 RepID=A0ABR4D4V4_9PEZI
MPRLLQRVRRPEASAGRPRPGEPADDDDVPLELPPYEPPSFPMDEKTVDAIKAMCSNSNPDGSRRQYNKHLGRSTEYLCTLVGAINDTLRARKQSLASMAERRQERGVQEPDEDELSLQQYIAELEATINELTDASEKALRFVIDCRAELEDHPAVLEKVWSGLHRRPGAQQGERAERAARKRTREARRRAGGDEEDEDGAEAGADAADEGEAPPVASIKELLEASRKAKADEYEALGAYERYALHNDYIKFKQIWHDAVHADDNIPLPDATTWFDELGRPNKSVVANDDDDLVVEREIIDLKCPLSLQVMKEPYSNHRCKHTFEKSAILEFLRSSGGTGRCPVCSKDVRIRDFYLDEVMLRKIKRAEEAANRAIDNTSDIDPEDDDEPSLVIGRATHIKKEKDRARQRMEEIDPEDD